MTEHAESSEKRSPKLTKEEQLEYIQRVISERMLAGEYDRMGKGVSVKELKARHGLK